MSYVQQSQWRERERKEQKLLKKQADIVSEMAGVIFKGFYMFGLMSAAALFGYWYSNMTSIRNLQHFRYASHNSARLLGNSGEQYQICSNYNGYGVHINISTNLINQLYFQLSRQLWFIRTKSKSYDVLIQLERFKELTRNSLS